MQLEEKHIRRFIDYLNSVHSDTLKIRKQGVTIHNYHSYYDNYKELTAFISKLNTDDGEFKTLFTTLPTLPQPNSLASKFNLFICSLHTSVFVFLGAYLGAFLLVLTAPLSIPFFIYGQIKTNEIKNKLKTIETTSSKLVFLLQQRKSELLINVTQ